MKENKWIDKLIIVVLIVCLVTAVFYFYDRRANSCTGNPLVFSAKLYEKNYEVEAIGTLRLLPLDKKSQPITINYNSTSFWIVE